jgi:hypothetical protein
LEEYIKGLDFKLEEVAIPTGLILEIKSMPTSQYFSIIGGRLVVREIRQAEQIVAALKRFVAQIEYQVALPNSITFHKVEK